MRDRPAEINLDLDGPNGGDWISPNGSFNLARQFYTPISLVLTPATLTGAIPTLGA